VAKLPLSAACTGVDYDITRPQPQLFVAEGFEQLGDVLDEVASGLAQERGGAVALERALASEELATLELDSGLAITGVLASVEGGPAEPAYLRLRGPCALSCAGRLLEGQGPGAHPEGYGTPLGRLADGAALSHLREADLARRARPGQPRRLLLRYRSGVRVEGRLERARCDARGRLLLLTLSDCTVERAGERLFDPSQGVYDLSTGESVRSARAGSADPAFWPESRFPSARVPSARERRGAQRELLRLYREALRLWERPRADELVPGFEALAGELRRSFPDEWLLPWNLLECLRKVGRGDPLARELRRDLLAIEARFPREAPISTGLRFLDERYPGA
jgi:phenylalanine-4-hydroxylase